MKQDLLNDLIDCEIEIRRLQEISKDLRAQISRNGSGPKVVKVVKTVKKRVLSPEGLKAIQESTKAMWARKRKAQKQELGKRALTAKQLKAMRANVAKARQALQERSNANR